MRKNERKAKIMKSFSKDKLTVKIMENRTEMGKVAAADIRAVIKALLAERDEINMIISLSSKSATGGSLNAMCPFSPMPITTISVGYFLRSSP